MGVVWCDNKKLEVEVNGKEVEELAMALDPRGKAFFKHWAENETKSHQEYDRGEKRSYILPPISADKGQFCPKSFRPPIPYFNFQ